MLQRGVARCLRWFMLRYANEALGAWPDVYAHRAPPLILHMVPNRTPWRHFPHPSMVFNVILDRIGLYMMFRVIDWPVGKVWGSIGVVSG